MEGKTQARLNGEGTRPQWRHLCRIHDRPPAAYQCRRHTDRSDISTHERGRLRRELCVLGDGGLECILYSAGSKVNGYRYASRTVRFKIRPSPLDTFFFACQRLHRPAASESRTWCYLTYLRTLCKEEQRYDKPPVPAMSSQDRKTVNTLPGLQ